VSVQLDVVSLARWLATHAALSFLVMLLGVLACMAGGW